MRRLVDGTAVYSCNASDSSFAAADDASGTFYTSDGSRGVLAWTQETGLGARAWISQRVEEIGATPNLFALAVVPPASGRRKAHLVVAQHGSSHMSVLELPSRRLVSTVAPSWLHRIAGIAADPHGAALVVTVLGKYPADPEGGSDQLKPLVHVLPWPLDGLPELA